MKRIEFLREPDLARIPLPERTGTYSPVAHQDVVELFKEKARERNLVIAKSGFSTARDGDQLIATFDIRSHDEELGMRGVFVNSYDKSKAFSFALGAAAWICMNGVISGEVTMKRKHTGTVNEEIIWKFNDGFDRLETNFNHIISIRDNLKEIGISRRMNAELIGRMLVEEEIINRHQVGIIQQQMFKSKNFKTIIEPGYSAWDLYMHTSEAMKVSHPSSYMDDHIGLYNFMTQQFQLV